MENEVFMSIITADDALLARLARALELWREEMCLRGQTGRAAADASLLFLDMRFPVPPLSLPENGAVIAIAEDDRQAAAAFRLHASALLRPSFTWAELCDTLDASFDAWRHGLRWLRCGAAAVPLFQLRYAEAAGRETVLYGERQTLRVRLSFGKLLRELPMPPFLHCQRSYAVHPAFVEKWRSDRLLLRDGCTVMLSRSWAAECIAALRDRKSRKEAL